MPPYAIHILNKTKKPKQKKQKQKQNEEKLPRNPRAEQGRLAKLIAAEEERAAAFVVATRAGNAPFLVKEHVERERKSEAALRELEVSQGGKLLKNQRKRAIAQAQALGRLRATSQNRLYFMMKTFVLTEPSRAVEIMEGAYWKAYGEAMEKDVEVKRQCWLLDEFNIKKHLPNFVPPP